MAEGQAITTQAKPHRVLPDSGSGASQWARTGPRLCPLWAWAPGAGRSGSLCSPRGAAAARLWWACTSGFSQVFNIAQSRDRISPKALYERSVKAQCYVAPLVDVQRLSILSLIKGRQVKLFVSCTAQHTASSANHLTCVAWAPAHRCGATVPDVSVQQVKKAWQAKCLACPEG